MPGERRFFSSLSPTPDFFFLYSSVAWGKGSNVACFLFRHDHIATLPVLPPFLWTLPPHCSDALASPGSCSKEEKEKNKNPQNQKTMDVREFALASLRHDTSWPGELPVGHRLLRRKKVNTDRLPRCGESRPGWLLWEGAQLCLAAV